MVFPQVSLALSGPMGAGKSTIGALIARRVGLPFVDLDAEIERDANMSLAEIFAVSGEAGFRDLEAKTAARLVLGTPCVIALGGGAVLRRSTRTLLLDSTILVTLEAPPRELVSRLGKEGIARRPLLARTGNPEDTLREIIDSRKPAYAEAHAILATAGKTPESLATEIIEVWRRRPIVVPLGQRSYRVDASGTARAQLPTLLAHLLTGDHKALVVTESKVWPAVQPLLGPALESYGEPLILPSGEEHKTIESVERIWDAALDRGLDRGSLFIAVGGGLIGDMTGFAASTLLRGVRFMQIPTSLLAMVDASVGGKTGVDRPHGKNLVGAFHQPSAVVADTELLSTLPARELRAGLAEVVKTGLISSGEFLGRLERDAPLYLAYDPEALADIVRYCVSFKARVVADDERDLSGRRAALNFGHTVGHAIEAFGQFTRWNHGEAVALGMVAALRVGMSLGKTPIDLYLRARALLDRLGLPTDIESLPLAEILPLVMADKKRVGNDIAFVLVTDAGTTENLRLSLVEIQSALLTPST